MTIPTMLRVKSSNIHSIGHVPGPEGKGQTYITFKDKLGNPSGTYRYNDVPAEKHAELAAADSVGGHLNKNFKGQHDAVRLEEDDPVHAAIREQLTTEAAA